MKILLFRAHNGDPLSLAIQRETQSPYCHAAMLIDADSPYRKALAAIGGFVDDGGDMIVNEYWPEAQVRMLVKGERENCDTFNIKGWTAQNEYAAIKWWLVAIRDKISYDAIDLPRFLPLVRALLGSPDISEEATKRHMFCSDAVIVCCREAGHPILNAPGCLVAPGHVAWSTEITLDKSL